MRCCCSCSCRVRGGAGAATSPPRRCTRRAAVQGIGGSRRQGSQGGRAQRSVDAHSSCSLPPPFLSSPHLLPAVGVELPSSALAVVALLRVGGCVHIAHPL